MRLKCVYRTDVSDKHLLEEIVKPTDAEDNGDEVVVCSRGTVCLLRPHVSDAGTTRRGPSTGQ